MREESCVFVSWSLVFSRCFLRWSGCCGSS